MRRRTESGGSDNAVGPETTGHVSAGKVTAGDASDRVEHGAKVLAFPVSSHKRRHRNILLAVAGIVATLALVMGVAMFSPVLAVHKVVFEGNKLIGADVLQKAVAPILSKPLPQVTEREVQDLLAPVIQVKSARIEARPPSTLLVHIIERVPVALIKSADTYLLVDQYGVELGSTPDLEAAALPLIDGGKAAIGQDTFRAITAVLANLPQPIVAQLANATAKSPDAVELKLTDGRTVIWGNASDMELKAEVLTALLTAPPPTPEPGKPIPAPAQVFDVSAPRHPVTR
ncbi:cell division protein FtsQ/DivIB [Arthrobacter sp. E3]|uniref:cell division protein FtsQ/DivIB n=1 Tax=Arthrobacter sp. E3 TaxID=517402 RepID=UPI001A93EE74|nr:cell division protein FtsQ/DivIB [Arthrobacter sp. E3]